MIELSRLPHEFAVPKIRDSFMRQFLNQDDLYSIPMELSMNIYNKRNAVRTLHVPEHRPTGESMKRVAVSNIIRFVDEWEKNVGIGSLCLEMLIVNGC